jgi:hypothetical protein
MTNKIPSLKKWFQIKRPILIVGTIFWGIIGLFVFFAVYVGHLSWWAAIILMAIGMFINGLVAHFEDERPGGFNNGANDPRITKKDNK